MKNQNVHYNVPINYEIYEMNQFERSKFYLVSISVIFSIAFVFYHNILIAIATFPLSFLTEKAAQRYLANRRKIELTYQFKDALYAISASIAAGRAMNAAIKESSENLRLIHGDEALIVIEFDYMVKRFNESKETETQIFRELSERCRIAEIVNFFDTYLTCRETGGDIEKMVMKSATIITEKIVVKREIEVLTSQKKLEGKMLTLFPIIVIISLQIASPDYISVMYTTLTGRAVMTIALLSIIISSLMIHKITAIEL